MPRAQVYACAFYIDANAASSALRSNGATAEAVRTVDGAADALLAGPFRCRPRCKCRRLARLLTKDTRRGAEVDVARAQYRCFELPF